MKKPSHSSFRQPARLHKPDGRQSALLLLRLIETKDKERERPQTRVRLAEITLKRLWNCAHLSEPFLSEVSEWLLSAGWALFFARSTYAAVQVSAVENWPAISWKRIRTELKTVRNGKFNFDKFEHLFECARNDQPDRGDDRAEDD